MRKHTLLRTITVLILSLGTLLFAYFLVSRDVNPQDNQAATLTMTELKDAGLYSVLDPMFGNCRNNGEVDCTQAIQAAMDKAYGHEKKSGPDRGVVFFPSGDYLISNTLVGVLDREMARANSIQLVGSTEGRTPRLILKQNSFNDGVANNDSSITNKKAMVHFWSCDSTQGESGKECLPSWASQRAGGFVNNTNGNGAMAMSLGIRNMEFLIKSGNPDSIGLRFAGAQDNIISNFKVTFEEDGFAGIYNFIGTNAVAENIEIVGGKFGLAAGDSRWPTFNNIRLINQKVASISGAGGQMPFSLNGFYIEKETTPVIADIGINFRYSAGSNSGGAYALSDGVIKIARASNLPVIDNRADRQVSLQNVFFQNATNIIKNSETDLVAGNTTGWSRAVVYSNIMTATEPNKATRIVNLRRSTDNLSQIERVNVGQPDIGKMLAKHGVATSKLPSPDYIIARSKENNPAYIYVKHKGIQALNGNTQDKDIPADADIGPALQNIINTCSTQPQCFILFGDGTYPLKSTVELKANTTIMGTANYLTEFITNPSWRTTNQTAVFRTVDDANAKTALAFFRLRYNAKPTEATFNLIHWRAGRNSLVYNLQSTRSFPNATIATDYPLYKMRSEFLITNNGGGRWFGVNNSGNGISNKWIPNYRGLKIDGTTEPLTLYGLDPEDGGVNCLRNITACTDGNKDTYPPEDPQSMQVEIINAKNVSIRGFKCEDHNSVNIFISSNIFVNGVGGCTDWYFENVDQSLILNVASKFNATGGRATRTLYEEKKGGEVLLVKQAESISSIQTGQLPDFSKWDSNEVINTNTPTPIQSATATPRQSATPTPGSSPTPTLRASSTPIPSPTPEITYDVTQTMTPTPPLTGNICGKADVDGDGRFSIADFAEFAKSYGTGRNTCADKDVDYGNCGGRDVNRDGKLNIADFGAAGIGFAQRYYPKLSCAI